jgi:uncharacterized protein
MRIVLDTNVLVSALINPSGTPAKIVEMLVTGESTLCFDRRILDEYREVLYRPSFPFQTDQVDALLEPIIAAGESIEMPPAASLAAHLPDPDDAMFLEVAVAAGADYLVTGNARHFPVALTTGIRVVSPARFVEIMRPEPR